jgi:enoyl-[acyl-carrier-protein] reductase (NADH)
MLWHARRLAGSPAKGGQPVTRTLSGQTIVITGGGGGLGQSMSYALAREGAHLVVADIALEAATRVVERIIEGGGTAIALRTDVTDETQVNELIRVGRGVRNQHERGLSLLPHGPASYDPVSRRAHR